MTHRRIDFSLQPHWWEVCLNPPELVFKPPPLADFVMQEEKLCSELYRIPELHLKTSNSAWSPATLKAFQAAKRFLKASHPHQEWWSWFFFPTVCGAPQSPKESKIHIKEIPTTTVSYNSSNTRTSTGLSFLNKHFL